MEHFASCIFKALFLYAILCVTLILIGVFAIQAMNGVPGLGAPLMLGTLLSIIIGTGPLGVLLVAVGIAVSETRAAILAKT